MNTLRTVRSVKSGEPSDSRWTNLKNINISKIEEIKTDIEDETLIEMDSKTSKTLNITHLEASVRNWKVEKGSSIQLNHLEVGSNNEIWWISEKGNVCKGNLQNSQNNR